MTLTQADRDLVRRIVAEVRGEAVPREVEPAVSDIPCPAVPASPRTPQRRLAVVKAAVVLKRCGYCGTAHRRAGETCSVCDDLPALELAILDDVDAYLAELVA